MCTKHPNCRSFPLDREGKVRTLSLKMLFQDFSLWKCRPWPKIPPRSVNWLGLYPFRCNLYIYIWYTHECPLPTNKDVWCNRISFCNLQQIARGLANSTFGISSPSCKTALLANFQLNDISIKPADANTNRHGWMEQTGWEEWHVGVVVFIFCSCRCWQMYVWDCLRWYNQFWTYWHILSKKMFLPNSIQITMVLDTSVLSETSSEVSINNKNMTNYSLPSISPPFMLLVAFRGMLITTSRQALGDFTAIALCRLMAARHAHIVLGQTGVVQRLWCWSWKSTGSCVESLIP